MSKLTGKARARANKKARNQSKNSYFLRKKKMLSNIRKWNDPVLKETCSPVSSSEDVSDVIKLMKSVLMLSDNGLGIAAPQVGVSKRIFVTRPDVNSNDMSVFINASIISESQEREKRGEGCLSYPGVVAVIERPSEITVEYEDEDFEVKTVTLKGLEACVACHEYDHTKGVCLVGDEWSKSKEEPVETISEDVRE